MVNDVVSSTRVLKNRTLPHDIRDLQRPMLEHTRGRDDVVDHPLERRDKGLDLTLDNSSDPSLHVCKSARNHFFLKMTEQKRAVLVQEPEPSGNGPDRTRPIIWSSARIGGKSSSAHLCVALCFHLFPQLSHSRPLALEGARQKRLDLRAQSFHGISARINTTSVAGPQTGFSLKTGKAFEIQRPRNNKLTHSNVCFSSEHVPNGTASSAPAPAAVVSAKSHVV